jgi:hypothetical protein
LAEQNETECRPRRRVNIKIKISSFPRALGTAKIFTAMKEVLKAKCFQILKYLGIVLYMNVFHKRFLY